MTELYEEEKERLQELNLTQEQYEKALKEWCKTNNY